MKLDCWRRNRFTTGRRRTKQSKRKVLQSETGTDEQRTKPNDGTQELAHVPDSFWEASESRAGAEMSRESKARQRQKIYLTPPGMAQAELSLHDWLIKIELLYEISLSQPKPFVSYKIPMSDVPASKQGTSPRLASPPCAISPVRMESSMPSVSIAGSQEPRLEANGQTVRTLIISCFRR